MPNEPAESNFKHKIHATAYPCVERNGIIWTYMGPRQTPPPLPELLANLVEGCQVTQYQRECNYMQALEGDIDTLHWGFLHAGHLPNEKTIPGTPDYYATRHRNARMEVVEHKVGTSYGAYRPAGEDTDYWRMANFMLPFYTQNPTQLLGRKSMGNAWVPLDDEHCMVWQFVDPTPGSDEGIGGLKQGRFRNDPPKPELAGFLPHTTDGLGRWRAKQNARNDYGIDREWQKQNLLYSGMPNGAAAQDTAMQESMGPIYDRTKEHLGTTDGMIIRTRAKLLNAARALRDSGTIPAGVDEPALYRMRSGGAVVPRGLSGLEVCKDVLFDRALTVDLPVR